jgi:hypothetical protein
MIIRVKQGTPRQAWTLDYNYNQHKCRINTIIMLLKNIVLTIIHCDLLCCKLHFKC